SRSRSASSWRRITFVGEKMAPTPSCLGRFFRHGLGEVGIEPGTGEHPPALGGGDGDAERGSGLWVTHAGEEAQLDQLGLGGLLGSEASQCIVERQQISGRRLELLNIDE